MSVKEEETCYQSVQYLPNSHCAKDKKQVFGKRRVCLCDGSCQTVALRVGISEEVIYFSSRSSFACLLTADAWRLFFLCCACGRKNGAKRLLCFRYFILSFARFL